MKLMIVESPNKVKKISSILSGLGGDWTVAASVGHVRDLPEDQAGVVGPHYKPMYQLTERGKGVVAKLRELAVRSDEVYLATDPDREGEAIAWHLAEVLRLSDPRRVTFDSITDAAIRAALSAPRKIDIDLVRAQEARRVLDRLVGFTISPVLGHMLKERASAGRVQSPAVRLVVEREREIAGFKQTRHFQAKLHFADAKWSADWFVKRYLPEGGKYILDEELAGKAASVRDLKVIKSEMKDVEKAPPPPFTTSTLLQAASAQLRFKPAHTAKVSQALFEQGLITYHRTDSQNLSDDAIAEIREYAATADLLLPKGPRKFGSKQDAQEAHEAIRPTHVATERAGETNDEKALYDLIRKRAIASQLADAVYASVMVGMVGEGHGMIFHYQARSNTLKSKGWRALTTTDAADETDEGEGEVGNVPFLEVGTALRAEKGEVLSKVTEPPARYSQAGLIKKLEQLGIGRPSTYAAIITNIMFRGYVEEKKNHVHPADKAFRAIDALTGKFGFLEYDFTRDVEVKLDHVATGKATYLDVVAQADNLIQQELGRTGVDLSALTVPTTPQLQFAQKLAEKLGEEIPAEALSDRSRLGDWLTGAKERADKAFKERLKSEPASEAQIALIQRAIDEGKIEKPEGWPAIDKLSASLSIDAIMGGKKSRSKRTGKRR
ncbi:type I DNA topoisomerase (plasmid) [Allorhizobium sp. Av2]|nr:type I DNA topoisomerase [Allorhizobium sp. Av2]